MSRYLDLIFVGPEQALPIIVALILWLGLAALGALITAKDRLIEANAIYGWAVISAVFTVVGVMVRQPFFILACGAALLSLFGLYRAAKFGPPLFLPGMWRVVVLALPLLWIAGAMEPSQWDEFSQWLPAPKYLLQFDGFPTGARPFAGPTMFPAYPYGWPLLSYLSALIAGQFVANVTSTLNVFLILAFSTFALRTALRIAGKEVKEAVSWPFATAVVMFATVFNPTFIQKIILTAYSDVSTSVLMGFSLLIGFYFLESLAKRSAQAPSSLGWQLALAISLLINLRQANLVLVVVLLVALAILAVRDRDIRIVDFSKHLLLIIIPVALVYLSWRYYVAAEFEKFGSAEATLRPIELWNFSLIPVILKNMGYVAFKKIGFFAPMVIACVFAFRGLVKCRTPFDRISILIAGAFLGYTAFLFLTYLGHFAPKTAASVVSFWRYSTHNGMVAVAFISIGSLYFLRHRVNVLALPSWLKGIAMFLVVALPFAFAHKLRFDLEPPKPHFIAVAKDLAATLPLGINLFVMDPKGSGESGKITFFHLNIAGAGFLSAFQSPTLKNITRTLERQKPGSYLLIHSATPALSEILKTQLDDNKSYLFQKQKAGWTFNRDWRKPGTLSPRR